MDFERTRQWTAIVKLTHNMLKAARQQAWEPLIEMEVKRRTLIEGFFSYTAAPDEALDITEGTQEILAIDREIMALSRKQRHIAGTKPMTIHSSKPAKQAYPAYIG